MSLIARSYMDTDLLPEKRRIASWRDSATSVWDISAITSGDFFARVDAFHGHELMFGSIESTAQNTKRTASRIATDGLDYYLLQFYMKGGRGVTARGEDVTIGEGDLLVVDMTQPIVTTSREYRSIDLVLPRRLLAPMLVDSDAHGARRLDGEQPLVALLRSHLQALYKNGERMSEAEAIAVQAPTLALAASALNGVFLPEYGEPMRDATRMAVQRHIEQNLDDLLLSAPGVAAAFGISRATLYRLMAPKGGFQSYLRERRMHRCRTDIMNPIYHHRTIGEIAASWGFLNASAFSTAFARQFGISARECRHVAQGKAIEMATRGIGPGWSRWLMNLK